MSVKSLIEAVYAKHGELTPEILLDEARHPEHPLHHRFEWDDSKAAESWRLEQSAQLIRSVRITFVTASGQPADLRAFTATKGAESHRSTYRPTEEVVTDPLMLAIVLRDMERDWQTFKRRYEHLSEFAARFSAVAA